MINKIWFIPVMLSVLVLSGCLSPRIREEQQVPYKSEIQTVQSAVDEFQKKTSVLPIKTRDQSTPIYLKYPIDFKKLEGRFLAKPPENAFESGGIFDYVLVNVEKDPTVKLIDLTTVNKLQELQRRVQVYRDKNAFVPMDKVLVKYSRLTIDYEKLGYDAPPFVKSPFTDYDLDFVMDAKSNIYIDYRKDLTAFLKKYNKDVKPGEDIRKILVNHSPFVPVYSLPYTINNNGDPVFLVK